MTSAEELIRWAHAGGFCHIYPPQPLHAIEHAASECGVSQDRVREVLKEHGSCMYPQPDAGTLHWLLTGESILVAS